MRFVKGSQSRGSISATAASLLIAAAVSPGAALSVAQENLAQDDVFTKSIPAEIALTKIEADGQSPSEARQLLQARLSTGQKWSNHPNGDEIGPSDQLKNDQLDVRGSLGHIDLAPQVLISSQEFGLTQLLYKVVVVEVPTEEAKAIVANWNLVGGVTRASQKANSGKLQKNDFMPDSFTASTTTSGLWISDELSEEQVDEIVELGKVIDSPELIGENGAEVTVRIGRDVEFVAGYERGSGKDGNRSNDIQPVVKTISDGIKLGLTGVFDEKEEKLQLSFSFQATQFKGMGKPFAYGSDARSLPVQQPEFTSTNIQASCKASANKTVALCSGPVIRESVEGQGISRIGRIPYVGKLFKNPAKATESIFTIILIRCQEHSDASPSCQED